MSNSRFTLTLATIYLCLSLIDSKLNPRTINKSYLSERDVETPQKQVQFPSIDSEEVETKSERVEIFFNEFYRERVGVFEDEEWNLIPVDLKNSSLFANTVQVVESQSDNVLVTLSDVSTKRYEYDLRKSDLETQRLVAAELRVLLDCDVYQSSSEEEEGKEQDVLFEVYHHTVLSRKNKLPLKRRILKKSARLCQEHSIVFDITAAVRQWMVAPIDIHEISIEVRHADGRPLQSTDHINLDLDGVQFPVNPLDIKWDTSPVLVLYLFDEEGVSHEDVTHLLSKEKEIVKRSVISVPESEISVSESSCRLVKRDVYVADIGLQDIKFPTRINLNYCAGSCNWPFPDEVNAPRSAWMQGRISHLSGEMPPPCCAPKDFDPVVISRKIGNIMQTKVEMIKVSSCECK